MRRAAPWLCLAALVLLGLGVRVCELNRYHFSPDDLLHLEIASGDSLRGVWFQAAEQMHPPLMYFLLHFLEQLTLDARFYRYLPLVPGLLLILVLFSLGRTVAGTPAGIAAAFVTTFGAGAAILSQVIRPYGLLAVLLGVALSQFILYTQQRKMRHLVVYGVVSLLGAALHYGFAIQLLAISVAWGSRLVFRRETRREWLRFLAVSAAPFALLAVQHLWHVSALSDLYADVRQSYLQDMFAADAVDILRLMREFFEYMLAREAWWLGALLFPIGLYALYRKSPSAGVVVVLCVAINLALTCVRLYPFGGSRHSFVLFPVMALTLGAGVQWLVRTFVSRFKRFRKGVLGRPLAWGVGAVSLLVTVAAVWTFFSSRDFMRTERGWSSEFPVRRDAYDAALALLRKSAGSRDVVFANRQTGHYLLFEARYAPSRIHSYRSDDLFHFTIGRGGEGPLHVYVVESELFFERAESLTASLGRLTREIGDLAERSVWVFNVGWRMPIEAICEGDTTYARLVEPYAVEGGSQLYRLSGEDVQELAGHQAVVP